MRVLPAEVKAALRCGPPIKFREWRALPGDELTDAERAMRFVERYLRIPDGPEVGKPILLDPFQEALFYQVIDTPAWKTILSLGRKNAKTATTAALVLCFIVGPLARQNDELAAAANSRDQAAHLYKYAAKMLQLNRELVGLYKLIPSTKMIVGVRKNVTFRAISAEAKTAHGGNYRVVTLDELGQVTGQTDEFYDALVSGQGAQTDPKFVILSTQAPTDSAILSTIIDAAITTNSQETAVHLYAADPDCAIDDESQWRKANPALGNFRSIDDVRRQCEDARNLPSANARFRNLVLNQRISSEQLFVSPDVWRRNDRPPDVEIMRRAGVTLGLDLSQRTDLTAAVLSCADDEGDVHLKVFAFTPAAGLDARATRDRVPYQAWVDSGHLIAVPGEFVDYDYVCEYLKGWLDDEGIFVNKIAFDRWRINEFKKSAERTGFAVDAVWQEVGQGYKDMSPRVESFEGTLLRYKLRHGSHPVLNMGASCAIVTTDPAGGRKLDKSKASQRIDALVAAVMSVHEVVALAAFDEGDISHWIA